MDRVRSNNNGYTIVETMIFLAVSGALLASAIVIIGGQQSKVQFATTVREFDSKLQSIVGNVATGYYNNTGNTFCNIDGSGKPAPSGSGGFSGQNADCIFIGQVIVPTSTGITIYSTAGLRLKAGIPPQKEVSSMVDAKPELIEDTAESYALGSGVSATIKTVASGQSVNSMGIFTTFNTYNNNLLKSGSTTSDIYAIGRSASTSDIEDALVNPGLLPSGYEVNPLNGIQFCLTDGSQYAAILLNNGSTRTSIGSGSACP